jgi:hypothetical protein
MPRGDFNIPINLHGTGSSSWTSGNGTIKYFPLSKDDYVDLESLAKDHIFNSAGPSNPVFEKNDKLLTFGSCFARELGKWLANHGRTSQFVYTPTGLNNSFAVRQYIEWVTTGNRATDAYWYDVSNETWQPQAEQETVLNALKEAHGFVFTFGLSEVWRDRKTRGVFWRGVPKKAFDPEIHECVVSSVGENLDNMLKIRSLIREHVGNQHIIYTLSPIPLNATFLERSIFESDCVSKSVLRVALNEFFNNKFQNTWYWPSFEFARWCGSHSPHVMIGSGKNARDIPAEIVKIIIDNFAVKFLK